MALNREIWINTITENFYPDNSFMAKSIDDSAFVNNKTVHIPNAGKPSSVVINRSEKPAKIKEREDNELTYNIDELTTDPIHISNVAREAHTSATASGNRKKITKAVVMKVFVRFNMDDVPADGRFMLLDAAMYADLLDDLTDKELSAFLACADASRGVLGKLYGFEIMQRSQVLRTTANGAAILKWEEDDADTELAAGLAWQQDCVSRALGDVKMFDDMGNPTYYGDIYSFLVRTGGSPRRYDGKGIAAIIESNAA